MGPSLLTSCDVIDSAFRRLVPPIVHRDLKSPNIFIASHNPVDAVVAKVGDFGVSSSLVLQSLREAKSNNRAVKNPTWVAPEILSYGKNHLVKQCRPFSDAVRRGEEYSLASDVYSFGLILWELWTAYVVVLNYSNASSRKHPFEEFASDIEKEDAIREGRRPAIPTDCWTEYTELIERSWVG